jgi:leucyl-tRNA synthetase
VINPDEVIAEHGADALRLYEMFLGPLEAVKPWATQGIVGIRRFLDKVWNLYHKKIEDRPLPKNLNTLLHKTIKKVGEDIEKLRFNTAISTLMILVNESTSLDCLPAELARNFLLILAPFAPHITEELWGKSQGSRVKGQGSREQGQGARDKGQGTKSIHLQPWPKYEEKFIQEDTMDIVVQVNGRVRDKITVAANAAEEEIKQAAQKAEKAQNYLAGQTIVKVIYVAKKLVNIVTQ